MVEEINTIIEKKKLEGAIPFRRIIASLIDMGIVYTCGFFLRTKIYSIFMASAGIAVIYYYFLIPIQILFKEKVKTIGCFIMGLEVINLEEKRKGFWWYIRISSIFFVFIPILPWPLQYIAWISYLIYFIWVKKTDKYRKYNLMIQDIVSNSAIIMVRKDKK